MLCEFGMKHRWNFSSKLNFFGYLVSPSVWPKVPRVQTRGQHFSVKFLGLIFGPIELAPVILFWATRKLWSDWSRARCNWVSSETQKTATKWAFLHSNQKWTKVSPPLTSKYTCTSSYTPSHQEFASIYMKPTQLQANLKTIHAILNLEINWCKINMKSSISTANQMNSTNLYHAKDKITQIAHKNPPRFHDL